MQSRRTWLLLWAIPLFSVSRPVTSGERDDLAGGPGNYVFSEREAKQILSLEDIVRQYDSSQAGRKIGILKQLDTLYEETRGRFESIVVLDTLLDLGHIPTMPSSREDDNVAFARALSRGYTGGGELSLTKSRIRE